MNTVWIYVDTSKEVGDLDHLNVFASKDTAETWLQENDPEGVAFEYVNARSVEGHADPVQHWIVAPLTERRMREGASMTSKIKIVYQLSLR
jgi:hypothetical protein